jgi:hypothetical protein
MAVVAQIASVSYPAVLNDMRKAENQWAESACMREMERQGMIKRKSFGSSLDPSLDYKRNPGTDFLATDLTSTSLSKTEVITSASYTIAELSVPVVWSKKDEVQNPSENQKIALVKGLLENGINSHDDAIEEALFAATATDGFNSFPVLFPDSGQGTVGAVDSSTETWWRHPSTSYTGSSDIEASFTTNWNSAAKGSGASSVPTMMVSGATPHAQFESTQQALQRYIDTQEAKAGFKILGFKTCRYVFSQYGSTQVYVLNPKATALYVSKEYFRDKGDTTELPNANGYVFKIYSALQLLTSNKSRNGKVHL